MNAKKRGKIDVSDRVVEPPEKHEFHTARILASFGHDVYFIRPSLIPHQHRADVFLDNNKEKAWEIKAPKGNSKNTIHNLLREANTQSKYIIIDLYRTKMAEKICLNRILHEMEYFRSIKHIKVITKTGSTEQERIIDIIR